MKQGLNPMRDATPWRFFLATNRKELKWLALNGFFYGCATTSMVGTTYLLGRVIDILQTPSHPHILRTLILIILTLFGYEIGFRIGHILEVLTFSRMRAKIKKTLFDHTTSLSFGYFADRFAGEIAHKISVTSNALERIAMVAVNQIVEQSVLFFITAIALGLVAPSLGMFVFGWSVVFVCGLMPLASRMSKRANEYAEHEAKVTGAFVDVYTNIAAFKVFGSDSGNAGAHKRIDAEARAYRWLGFWSIVMHHYEGLSIVALGTGLMILTGTLFTAGSISIGEVVFIGGAGLRLLVNVWEVGRNLPDLIRSRGEATQNLRDLVMSPAILDGDHPHMPTHDSVSVNYKDVTFSYSNQQSILNRFSLSIEPGEKIGVVGLSGAGKTTFANLLLRFFDVTSGSILINGADIRNFSQAYLRSHISYISQETSLFHTTIAENIAYGSEAASRTNIEHAACLAFADEFIRTLPHGYESVVGERGIKLSGGQRQRIAIARAILADRPLFLLDEATSALDSDSEAKIQKGLATLMKGKTVIAIAHRLSTLSHMDRIIFLEAGAIVEDGTHEELLERGGKYAALWKMQAGGFLPDTMPEQARGA